MWHGALCKMIDFTFCLRQLLKNIQVEGVHLLYQSHRRLLKVPSLFYLFVYLFIGRESKRTCMPAPSLFYWTHFYSCEIKECKLCSKKLYRKITVTTVWNTGESDDIFMPWSGNMYVGEPYISMNWSGNPIAL